MKYHIEFDIDFKRNTEKGMYIVLEGIDATGKTTQVEQLCEYLKKEKRDFITVREPRKDDGLVGALIQQILRGKTSVPSVAFQYLFSADRQMHHEEVILPALKKGKIVISDRCFWSAIPYGLLDKEKGVAKNAINQTLVAQSILSFYHQFTVPDITFYLHAPLKIAMQRLSDEENVKVKEIYEDQAKLRKAARGYEWLLNTFPKEFTIINADQPVGQVTEDILQSLKKYKKK